MLQQVLDELQSAGLRATTPRVKVLEFFRTSGHRHCSAEDVFRQLVDAKVDIALATVYRALAQLVEAGILTSGVIDSSKVVYELNEGKRHDHIVCINCGRIDEFSDPLMDARQKAVSDGLGYLLTGHQLVLHGYCSNCRPEPQGKKTTRKR
ncbi:Fur family transcriptional regulator [Paraburkholderia caballeronis]|uniref:Ferric uptake regulation protein n=1 Tax=Paraburkholderia caballeronis TaxID=416943 RepID=A0A1H7FLQ5_9BURK|nr:Fur family transcriptional regulator [Paraburkholderia caballeronis]PXW25041.1 Fur family ferric uptake transcriptional regulator [Paraburkholderia caballeronis]PXW93225.1 Fur family ferric uptake transcriptional regulator [Paraburkholderia caballeronis]RAJ86676.1 Fur family ferric uptake transcriptional regulator [Paraburkholderia caballeronis]TDV04357.1 Fur family ferric uptake transcriptional regulator [Paraburkholderia caballeronis]TDV17715.1 Fur family ferric uptake transcriptional reg